MSNPERTPRGQQRTDDRIAQLSSDERGQRGSSEADLERTLHTGTMTTVDELAELNFDEFRQEALPNPPAVPGYHLCWLSTTSSYDPISKRQRLGYSAVTAAEVPGFQVEKTSSADGQDGLIRCNEMALFKIPMERYLQIMRHFHHDEPRDNEAAIREQMERVAGEDVKGRGLLVDDEDGFKGLLADRRKAQFAAA
jgi:hypothetical protein